MPEKKLEGLNIVYFETRHAKTLGDLLRIHGANAISAPSVKEIPLEENKQVFAFAEEFFKGRVPVLILLTGVGTRVLLSVLETRYPKEKIIEQLKKTIVVPRGPKPIRVLNELGVPYAVTVPEPNTWKEVLSTLDENKNKISLKDSRVAIQEYGISNDDLRDGLKARGAQVLSVPVYRWALPDDTQPLEEAIHKIIEGSAQVVVFTTSVQLEHLFQVAEKIKKSEALKKAFSKRVVASVGPDCSETIRRFGLTVDIEPQSPKMGPLIQETAEKAREILKHRTASRGEGLGG
jgi:uroporphyrinogen-III synthase